MDMNGVTVSDRVCEGTGVTAAYYRNLLNCNLRPKIHTKVPDMLAMVYSYCMMK
jgi:hypothetical protein